MARKKRARSTFVQRSREKAPAELAAYHQVTGAGKSRVKREFFGLNDDDVAAITKLIEDGIAKRLRRA